MRLPLPCPPWRGALWGIITLLLAALSAHAEDGTSFTAPPPAIYKEKLAKLLTPLDTVLKRAATDKDHQSDGIVLLDEEVTFVGDDGKRVIVYHTVQKALTDAGVKSMAQDSFNFKKSMQRLYLVTAQTIQPDGRHLAVQHDAVFLKTPQSEADDSIYDDESEMVTVYSDVKVGSVTENITVLVDSEPRIPNEFSQTFTWNEGWPEDLQRWTVLLPKSYADRLKITKLGTNVPDFTKTDGGNNREQLTWEQINTPADPERTTDPPSDQVGPMVWLSTLKSWDAFAAWYTKLCAGTDQLSPELKTKVDAWTKDAKAPAEITRILYQHAALDVRYTAFELGQSDLQPHDCKSVWGRQYGDCKDKANLLRAMLEYKGVPAWLTLLDTEHAGHVNEANPDYRQFDHCILYVQTGENTFVICDPTMTYGVPGLLNGDESDRDILVVKGKTAQWIHTPPLHDAQTTYTFDLQLRTSGELAGWMEIKGEGYYASYLREKYAEMSKEQARSDLQDDVQSFFPNANVVDVEMPKSAVNDPASPLPPPFTIRAYMVLTGVLNQADVTSQLKFPVPSLLLPDLTDYKDRRHATFTWPDKQMLNCKIHLPAGWNAPSLPLPLHYQSPALDYQVAWTTDKDVLTAACQVQVKQSLFPPDDFITFGDSITNLKSWSSKALSIDKSANPNSPAPPPATDNELAANLPVMPTGEGQLNLIDSEFPDDGNLAARRAALEHIPTLFPSDIKSITEAGIKIAVLDLDNEKWSLVLSRLQPLEAANRARLDVDTIAWADYIIALALQGQGKKAEALALFQKIADNTDVADGRRAWSIYEAAAILAKTSPTAALDYADKALNLSGDAGPELFGFYASTAIQTGAADRLKDRLAKLIAAKPDNLEDILIETSNSAQNLIDSGHKKEGLTLLTLLEGLSNPATTGGAFASALQKVRDGANASDKFTAVQDALKQALANAPDIAALEKKQPAFASIDDARKSMQQDDNNSDATDALGCSLRILTAYPIDGNFAENLWNCAQYSEWSMRQAPSAAQDAFFFKLSTVADLLPHTDEKYTEIKILNGEVLENKNRRNEAAVIYAALRKQPDLPEGFIGPVGYYGGNNCAEQADYSGALDYYKFAEPKVDSQLRAQQATVRAAFINFDNGNQAEALRLVNLLSQAVQSGKIKPEEQVANIADMATNTNTPPALWANANAWWPQWQHIESYAGLAPVKDHKIIPVVASMSDLGKSLGEAKNNKDTAHFFELMRQLAYAARFYQTASLEFVGAFSTAEEMLPDRANDFRLLAISILQPMTPTEARDQRARVLYLLINYFDSNQPAKAMDLMRSWDGSLEDGGKVCAGIHRVWALAAMQQHQDLAKLAALLAKDVKTTLGLDRSQTTGVLSDVYVAGGLNQDAAHLLETEIADPELAGDASGVQDLKTRLDNIQKVSESTKQLADGVTVWLKDHKPAWWDFAEPKTPDDPRMARLGDILRQNDDTLAPAELVKAGLLAPSATTLSADTQQDAVLNAFRTMLNMAPTQADADALAYSVLDNNSFPVSLKSSFLFSFLLDAYTLQKTASYETFLNSPIYLALSEHDKMVLGKITPILKLDRTSSTAINVVITKVTKGPLDALDIGFIQDAVTYLLQVGDIPSAQAVFQASATYTFSPEVRTSRPEFRLALLKQINAAKDAQPAFETLRKLVLAAYPPDKIKKPAGLDSRRNYTDFEDLTYDEATQYRLYLVKIRQATPSVRFWYDFMFDLPHDAANSDLCLNLIKAGLDATPDDETKAFQVSFGASVLDLDNPDVREKFTALIQPYRDPAKYPRTMENIRLFDAETALRLGKMMNLEVDLGGFTASSNIREAEHFKLRAYQQANNLSRLKTALNALSADEILSPSLISDTLPALDAAGLQDEATLARDYLTQKIYRDVLACWFSPTGYTMQSVTNDLDGLQTAKDLPDNFIAFAKANVQRKRSALAFQIALDYANKKWDAVAQASQDMLTAYPTYYSYYWTLGRSLAELGRKDEAIKALSIYVRYSLDEADYPKAKDLLAKLGPPKT